MALVAYKYRFKPSKEQAEMLEHTFGRVRFIYNNALAFSKGQYEQDNKTHFSDWNKTYRHFKMLRISLG